MCRLMVPLNSSSWMIICNKVLNLQYFEGINDTQQCSVDKYKILKLSDYFMFTLIFFNDCRIDNIISCWNTNLFICT